MKKKSFCNIINNLYETDYTENLQLGLQVSSYITLWALLVKLGLLFLWGSRLLPAL